MFKLGVTAVCRLAYLLSAEPCPVNVAASLLAPHLQSLFKQLHELMHGVIKLPQVCWNSDCEIQCLRTQETYGYALNALTCHMFFHTATHTLVIEVVRQASTLCMCHQGSSGWKAAGPL
jgi:hypothetical protein